MKYKNPSTGETRILGVHGRNRQALELEAQGWEHVRGTDAAELRAIQQREEAARQKELAARQEAHGKVLNVQVPVAEVRRALDGEDVTVASEGEPNADLPGSGTDEDAGDAGNGDAGHLPDSDVRKQRSRRLRDTDA